MNEKYNKGDRFLIEAQTFTLNGGDKTVTERTWEITDLWQIGQQQCIEVNNAPHLCIKYSDFVLIKKKRLNL